MVETKWGVISSYILDRSIKGIQALTDSFVANGVETYAENVNGTNKSIKQLESKTNKLVRTVDKTVSELENLSQSTKSSFEQTAEAISSKVSKNNIISEINQTAEEVQIKADKINLDGAVFANISLTSPIISGGAISIGGNNVILNDGGIFVMGGTSTAQFRVDNKGVVAANSLLLGDGNFLINSSGVMMKYGASDWSNPAFKVDDKGNINCNVLSCASIAMGGNKLVVNNSGAYLNGNMAVGGLVSFDNGHIRIDKDGIVFDYGDNYYVKITSSDIHAVGHDPDGNYYNKYRSWNSILG